MTATVNPVRVSNLRRGARIPGVSVESPTVFHFQSSLANACALLELAPSRTSGNRRFSFGIRGEIIHRVLDHRLLWRHCTSCAASSASTATPRPRTSRTSGCTRCSTAGRSRPASSPPTATASTRRRTGPRRRRASPRASWTTLPGHLAIGHVRYSTAGGSALRNAQPFAVEYAHGCIARRPQRQPHQRRRAAPHAGARRRRSSSRRPTPRSSST